VAPPQLRAEVTRQLALALRDEVNDLETAGLKVIQVDEPALREGLPLRRSDRPTYLAWATEAFRLATSGVRAGDVVLDLAGGTGDIAALLLPRVGDKGAVVVGDINGDMLRVGRDRLLDRGRVRGLDYAQLDAESLPFPDKSFDCVTMAFGLRNVTHKERALAEIHRVLKVGGRALILEFSRVRAEFLKPLYDFHSFEVLPRLGKLIAGDEASYRYLAESIRKHPDQEALKAMMETAGLARVDVRNLAAGIVAIHRGYRV